MGRKAKEQKSDKVHLRLKSLRNGYQRYYLDFSYNGRRHKEYLTDLTLKPNNSKENRAYNSNITNIAEKIKVERQEQITNGTYGTDRAKEAARKKALLLDVMELYRQEKEQTGQSNSLATTIHNVMMYLESYKGKDTKMQEVDTGFCKGFIQYLAGARTFATGKIKGKGKTKPLAKSTAKLYFNTFTSALNWARDEKFISHNPINDLKRVDKNPIKPPKTNKGYLTADEVLRLMDTPFSKEDVKRAFLFGCFCGLRISDVANLKWGNIRREGKSYKVDVTMKKTESEIVVTLNSYAQQCLPERGKAKAADNIFHLSDNSIVNKDIKKWVKAAGIDKDISFHISRHTFATMLITSGVDVLTVSKLLGHKNVSTTQIYADVIDEKKDEAVNNQAEYLDKRKAKRQKDDEA